MQQVEADLHRETAFVWLLRWLVTQDEELKNMILHGDPMEQQLDLVKWQAKRQLIEAVFEAIEEIRRIGDGDQGIQ